MHFYVLLVFPSSQLPLQSMIGRWTLKRIAFWRVRLPSQMRFLHPLFAPIISITVIFSQLSPVRNEIWLKTPLSCLYPVSGDAGPSCSRNQWPHASLVIFCQSELINSDTLNKGRLAQPDSASQICYVRFCGLSPWPSCHIDLAKAKLKCTGPPSYSARTPVWFKARYSHLLNPLDISVLQQIM